MGKVLASISNGFPGTVSRSIDNVIISMKNYSGGEIPFGAPVFLQSGQGACQVFDPDTSTEEAFLGFTVRVPDKTPDTYGSDTAAYATNDPVDVLVRGSVVLQFGGSVNPGSSVYIRKSDGVLVTDAGASGTTFQLPGVTVRTVSDGSSRAEVILKTRNIR